MRQQLFDYVMPVAPPPRLQPNLYAKIARTSYLHATKVILFWIALCAAVITAAIFNPQKSARPILEFSGADSAARNMGILNSQFPNLNALMTFNISHPNPEQLKLARVNLINELEKNSTVFALVLAPGAGDYYEDHALLYMPLNEVNARVEYALSLKPLFAAIATSPTTESLATLVNEVSASITLGRDPQGLDAMFDEASKAVQSLMEGNARHVDWSHIAELNFDPTAQEAIIMALPKLGKVAIAKEIAAAAATKISTLSGTKIVLQKAKNQSPNSLTASTTSRTYPFLALAILFVGFVFFATIGQFGLAFVILVPVLTAEIIGTSVLHFVFAEQLYRLWPVLLAIAITGLQISTRLSFAVLESSTISSNRQSAVMLAFQKQGAGIVRLVSLVMLVWFGWFAVAQTAFLILTGVTIFSLVIAFCATFTLIPACLNILGGGLSWRAEDWVSPIYLNLFSTRTWRILRKYAAIAIVLSAIPSLYFLPKFLATTNQEINRDHAVNVLARSKQDAEAAVLKLSRIPEAQSVRWLGAFLPQQGDEKLSVLQTLRSQFPRFQPLSPQEPAALRDQITSLLVSLEEIATSSAARPALQNAAHNFRRSLEILANTTTNAEVLEFENRIFGAFNLLADRAEFLANLNKPELETLDPKLKTLFVSSQNIFRLEVMPIAGVSPSNLARILVANGLAVAHPTLPADNARTVLLATSAMIIGAVLLLGLLGMVFAIRETSGSIASLLTSFVALCSIFAVAELSGMRISQSAVLQATSLIAALLAIIATAFLKQQITNQPPPDALHAAEAWLPTMVIAGIAAPAGFLNFTPWAQDLGIFAISLSVITSTIALLLRPLTISLRRYGF